MLKYVILYILALYLLGKAVNGMMDAEYQKGHDDGITVGQRIQKFTHTDPVTDVHG